MYVSRLSRFHGCSTIRGAWPAILQAGEDPRSVRGFSHATVVYRFSHFAPAVLTAHHLFSLPNIYGVDISAGHWSHKYDMTGACRMNRCIKCIEDEQEAQGIGAMANHELRRNLGSVTAVLLLLLGYSLNKDKSVSEMEYAPSSPCRRTPPSEGLRN